MAASSNTSRADTMAREIEQSVASGRFQPDDFIGTKDDLQRQFSVARGTLNEAIRLLRSRAVIKVKPGVGGGIFVAGASPVLKFDNLLLRLNGASDFAEECLRVKDALDPAVAADAALHRTPRDIEELNAIIHEMARSTSDPTHDLQVNWRLHRRIGQISPNTVMRSLYLCLMDILNEQLVEALTHFDESTDQRLEVHLRLVEAIAAGDTAAASYWGGERHRFPFGARAQGRAKNAARERAEAAPKR